MQLETIEFEGYKRLRDARCNVSGATIAFVGPNEAGKSSVLEALAWSTDVDAGELPPRAQHRANPPNPTTAVVRAYYRPDADDLEFLRGLGIDPDRKIDGASVGRLLMYRRADGRRYHRSETAISRSRAPFNDAALQVHDALVAIEHIGAAGVHDLDETTAVASAALNKAQGALETEDLEWTNERVALLDEASEALAALLSRVVALYDDLPESARASRRNLEIAGDGLRAAAAAGRLPDPKSAIGSVLAARTPKFILFGDKDRDLAESYDLSDENLRSRPPAPLQNVLRVARTTVEEVWAAISADDPGTLRTLQKRINTRLRDRLQPKWSQSQLAVDITLNIGGLVEVNIDELETSDGAVTPISERSDGLRTFLGLVCFLVATEATVPPVLMIDEAERNLHYDAQADLVRVLTHDLEVSKVLYTTHSPGCLPLDLGTGIRVVHRDEATGGSTLRNTFWTEAEPGFSRLLFVMGAQAAAFSAFRRAVLTEGVSEMILLPTLLRNATGGSPVTFQVAFGLSNMSVPDAIGTIALRTTYLVDGDTSGDAKRDQLIDAGVPTTHILQLPSGTAIEDLVDRETYLAVVNRFLEDTQAPGTIDPAALDSGQTIAKAVDLYVAEHLEMKDGVGHKIIASRLAELGDRLQLAPGAAQYLRNLRSDLEEALDRRYEVQPSTEAEQST